MPGCKTKGENETCIECKSDYKLDKGVCVYDTPLGIKIIVWFIGICFFIAVSSGGIYAAKKLRR